MNKLAQNRGKSKKGLIMEACMHLWVGLKESMLG